LLKRIFGYLCFFGFLLFFGAIPLPLFAQPALDRIAGETSMHTAVQLYERSYGSETQNLILAASKNLISALPAVVLAAKLDAPLFLADEEALFYAQKSLAKNGTLWLIGETAPSGDTAPAGEIREIGEDLLWSFPKINFLEGADIYQTSTLIAGKLESPDTVIICPSKNPDENIAELITVSSIAARNGWPILPVPAEKLPDPTRNYLLAQRLKTIYILGSQQEISYRLEEELRQIQPSASLERLGGANPFETSALILGKFVPNPQSLYFSSSSDFKGLLSGILMAAKTGGAVILCDSRYIDLPPAVDQYLASLTTIPSVHVIGSRLDVSDETLLNAGQQQQPEVKKTDFVNLAEYIPELIIDLPYASTNNFTHTKLYDSNTAFLRRGTADKLKKVVAELHKAGYRLKIWDAYRPPAVQFKMWNIVPQAAFVANPWRGYSDHARGSALDLTIENLEMPTEFDDFSSKAHRINQNKNAKYLESVMVKHGFVPLASEWWHYTDSDKYEICETIPQIPNVPLRQNQVTDITVSVIGDLVLGQDDRFGNFNTYYRRYGPEYFFSEVKELLQQDTLTIANLEGTLTTSAMKADKEAQGNRAFWFKGDPVYTAILQAGSIEAVNLANNHSLDFLQEGYADTVAALTKAKITSFGSGKTAICGRIGLIGANTLGPLEEGINIAELKKELAAQIKTLKKEVPIVIVYFHWGREDNNNPDPQQIELGRFAVDQGADLVVGSHPHVVQPAEQYKGKTIVYSLGNFVFGGNTHPRNRETAIFQQTFRLLNGHLEKIEAGKFIPCYLSGTDGYNDYRPQIIKGVE